MNLAQKVVLVTGGARGLGRGFTEALLDRGANVCIADIQVNLGLNTARDLQKKYGQGRVMFIACDITKSKDMEDVFKHVKSTYGQLDIVVNNAGIGGEDVWEKMIDINLTAVVRGTLLAIQHMAKDNGGKGGLIINMGSTSGLTAVPFIPVYAATKHGVVGFSRSVAGAVKDKGVRVVCLCPSFTETEMFGRSQEIRGGDVTGSDDTSRNSPASVGVMQMPAVVAAFIRLVDDTHNNGGIMTVTPKGMEYKFPRSIKGKL